MNCEEVERRFRRAWFRFNRATDWRVVRAFTDAVRITRWAKGQLQQWEATRGDSDE